jgi:hypothetical protein
VLWLDVWFAGSRRAFALGLQRLGSILHSFLFNSLLHRASPAAATLQPSGNRLVELRRATRRRTGREVNTVVLLVEEASRSEMKKVAAFVSNVSAVSLIERFRGAR